MKPLRTANPPVMTPLNLQNFMEEVFGNILELRECNRRLLEVLYVRQREQSPVIQSVGDVFLDAATEFRTVYPIYVGCHPLAEKRMKEELEHNSEFRLFIEVRNLLCCSLFGCFSSAILEMFSPTCCQAGRECPYGSEALSQPTSRTPSKVSCFTRCGVSKNRGKQP